MSNVKQARAVKSKKQDEDKKVESLEEVKKPDEAPKKRGRTKKQPTREDQLKLLSDASSELKQIIQDLKEDEMRISSMVLKRIPELVKETLVNLQEDLEEIDEKHKEVLSLPAHDASSKTE